MAKTELTGAQIKDKSVSLVDDVTGILPVANGGSGSNSIALNNVILGNGTGAVQTVAPGATGNVLTSNGTTWTSASAPAGDISSNTSTSVDGEAVVFNGTTGKSLKRATGTGYAYLTSGVLSSVTAIPQSAVTSLVSDLAGKESTANKAQPNGYASLNASGVIPLTQQTYAVLDGGTSSSAGADVINGGTPASA